MGVQTNFSKMSYYQISWKVIQRFLSWFNRVHPTVFMDHSNRVLSVRYNYCSLFWFSCTKIKNNSYLRAILLYFSYTKIKNNSYVRRTISNLFWKILELLHVDRWTDIVTQIDVFLQLYCKCANINGVHKVYACYIVL